MQKSGLHPGQNYLIRGVYDGYRYCGEIKMY